VRFGDLDPIEFAFARIVVISKVVDIHRAIDFGRMHCRAPLPEQVGFFREAFKQQVELTPDDGTLVLAADLLLDGHQLLTPAFDLFRCNLGVECERTGSFFVGVSEDTHPVESRLADEVAEQVKICRRLAGETHDK